VLGALVAALVSFAHAKPAPMPHAADGLRGGGSGNYNYARSHQDARAGGRWYGMQSDRGAPADRNVHGQRAPNGPAYGTGYGSPPRMAGQDRSWHPDDGMRYAGAITPISTEGHPVPRPPANAPIVRAGSIRADVARYNEERGAARPIPRPPDDLQRPPAPSPYRN
jgi:hypothetical protein